MATALRAHRPTAPAARRRAASRDRMAPAEPVAVIIRGLAARTYIGITAEERAKRQDVLVDLTLQVNTRAGRTDRIEDAVDYKDVKDAVLRYVEGTEHDLLEALAQGIADRCLRHPGVEAVEVEVDKPGALRFARSVAVRLRRERQARPPPAPRNWGHRG